MGRVDRHARCVCASDDKPRISLRTLAPWLLSVGLVVMQWAQGAHVAQHQRQVSPSMDAVNVVDSGIALAMHITSADGAAIAIPYQGEAT